MTAATTAAQTRVNVTVILHGAAGDQSAASPADATREAARITPSTGAPEPPAGRTSRCLRRFGANPPARGRRAFAGGPQRRWRRAPPRLVAGAFSLSAYKMPGKVSPPAKSPGHSRVRREYSTAYTAARCLSDTEIHCSAGNLMKNGEDPTIRRRQDREAMNEHGAEAWRPHQRGLSVRAIGREPGMPASWPRSAQQRCW